MVSDSLSDPETERGGGGDSRQPRFHTYTEFFEYSCPYYMAMGMPYDLYWNGDIDAVKAYRNMDKLRQAQDNTRMWIQGIYFMEAVASVLSSGENGHKYPSRPYDLAGEDDGGDEDRPTSTEEHDRKVALAKMQEWAIRNNRVFEKQKAREAERAAAQEPENAETISNNL